MLLKGKTIVITGCNRGIGRAILEKSVFYGADVFAVIRKENEEFSKYVEKLKEKNHSEIEVIYCEFADSESVKQAAAKILKYKKKLDVLVNNVGVSSPASILNMTSIDRIKETFQINLFSALQLTQKLSGNMIKNRKGNIIFITSSAAFDGGSNIEYTASKAAIVGAVKRLAIEYGTYQIRVNGVAPGLTDTDMGDIWNEELQKKALEHNIMKRKGKPEEIADVVSFLASDMSSFMTGQVVRVDGGILG